MLSRNTALFKQSPKVNLSEYCAVYLFLFFFFLFLYFLQVFIELHNNTKRINFFCIYWLATFIFYFLNHLKQKKEAFIIIFYFYKLNISTKRGLLSLNTTTKKTLSTKFKKWISLHFSTITRISFKNYL